MGSINLVTHGSWQRDSRGRNLPGSDKNGDDEVMVFFSQSFTSEEWRRWQRADIWCDSLISWRSDWFSPYFHVGAERKHAWLINAISCGPCQKGQNSSNKCKQVFLSWYFRNRFKTYACKKMNAQKALQEHYTSDYVTYTPGYEILEIFIQNTSAQISVHPFICLPSTHSCVLIRKYNCLLCWQLTTYWCKIQKRITVLQTSWHNSHKVFEHLIHA